MRRKNISSAMMKEYMCEALLILLRDRPYDKIAIGQITERAGVDRSTYYRHFQSKDDIVRYYYDSLMEKCRQAFLEKGKMDFQAYMRTRFETLYLDKQNLLNLHKNGLTHLLLDVLTERYARREMHNPGGLELEFRRAYQTGGVYSSIELWFHHNMEESPELMTKMAMVYRPEESVLPWFQNPNWMSGDDGYK